MIRLLLTTTAYDRLETRLSALPGPFDCLRMGRDGVVRRAGTALTRDDAGPDCAFLSHDLFSDRLIPQFSNALEQAPALRWVQSAGAGIDHSIFKMLARKGVRLTTNHSQAVGMADYVLWGVLHHFQGGPAYAAAQSAQRWTSHVSREIAGSRWLIIGFGAIGEAVARRAKAFDAHVTAVRRRPEPSPHADVMTTPDHIYEHLGDSDVVLLCVPHSRQTEALINANFLQAMKAGSMLINVGRGSVVDEDALLAALDLGRPAHALLDVFRTEPLPSGSRFWSHPNVTVTAHTSALSTGLAARTDALLLDNLARYRAGEPLLNEVAADQLLV
jgi:phosphoglycerate dehydrogenase-like enzyme